MLDLHEIGSLEDLIHFSAIISRIMDDDIAVSVTDTGKIIKYISGVKLNLPLYDGMILPAGSVAKKSMLSGKEINEVVPSSVYGMAFRSICTPIFDGNKVIGAISISRGLEIQSELIASAENLSGSLQEISASIGMVANNAQLLAESIDSIMESAEKADNAMRETDKVLEFIKEIASQTNLLGLNAAIESARAGEAGKGFGIVSQEIRKLSTNSNEAAKQIHDIMDQAVKAVKQISAKVGSTHSATQEQAASTEEINAAIEELNAIAEMLITLGNKL